MSLKNYLCEIYRYSYWANKRILKAAEGLTEEQLFRDLGHSWGSVHGMLLHITNAEWIWLRRWQGISPTQFPDAEEFPTLEALRSRWSDIEREMFAFLNTQNEEDLSREVSYTSTVGKRFTMPLIQMMLHVPNHGTHHRGELAAMLTALGMEHEENDMLYYFQENRG